MSLKKKIPIYILASILLLKLLDSFIFSYLFLKFPNELEWDTSPWYNFLYKTKNLKFDPEKKNILFAGSSVAEYSYLPSEIDEKKMSIKFYSHVAMSPTDLYYYSDDFIAKKPDAVFYLVNTGDFQFDHFIKKDDSYFYSEEDRLKAYSKRHPVKFFYPLQFLLDEFKNLTKKEIFFLLTKSFLNVNRYRNFLWDPFESYIEHHFRSGRSYHNYLGPNANGKEIYRKGWTKKNFSIPCDKSKDYLFDETIFVPKENTEILISDYDGEIVHKEKFSTFGWKKLKFKIPPDFEPMIFYFQISNTVSSKEIDGKVYGNSFEYGIRLSQNFCKTYFSKNISDERLESRDDFEIEGLTEEEYISDYEARMYKDAEEFLDIEKKIPKRPEIQRLFHLHNVKRFLGNEKSEIKFWSEFQKLEQVAKKMQEAKIPFYILNNPENPLELELYSKSKFYSSYLDFFYQLTLKYPNTKFYDLKDQIKTKQFFIDSHHLTYNGSKEYTNYVNQKIIQPNMEEKK